MVYACMCLTHFQKRSLGVVIECLPSIIYMIHSQVVNGSKEEYWEDTQSHLYPKGTLFEANPTACKQCTYPLTSVCSLQAHRGYHSQANFGGKNSPNGPQKYSADGVDMFCRNPIIENFKEIKYIYIIQ